MPNMPVPETCSIEVLSEWLYAVAQGAHPRTTPGFNETPWERLGPQGREQVRGTARRVRELLEAKVRDAVVAGDRADTLDEALADHIVADVLGAP